MNLEKEKKLNKKGFSKIIGLDEAGRGALAGPVMIGGVLVHPHFRVKKDFEQVNDSKKLTPKKRESLYQLLKKESQIRCFSWPISPQRIDKINILEATKEGMIKIINNHPEVDYLLVDGNFKINSLVKQESILGGDRKIFSIAAASIIAKVERDNLMKELHKKFPQYKFNKHKGYGTKEHRNLIKKHGPSIVHRKSFRGVGKV